MAFTVTLKNKYCYSQRDLKLTDQKVWSKARPTANSIHILHLAGIEACPQIVRGDRAFSLKLCHPALQNLDKVHEKTKRSYHYLTE